MSDKGEYEEFDAESRAIHADLSAASRRALEEEHEKDVLMHPDVQAAFAELETNEWLRNFEERAGKNR